MAVFRRFTLPWESTKETNSAPTQVCTYITVLPVKETEGVQQNIKKKRKKEKRFHKQHCFAGKGKKKTMEK